jgi:hypothetical protein
MTPGHHPGVFAYQEPYQQQRQGWPVLDRKMLQLADGSSPMSTAVALTGCILGIVCTESGRRESNPHHQLGRLSHKLPSLIAATEFSTRKKPPAR